MIELQRVIYDGFDSGRHPGVKNEIANLKYVLLEQKEAVGCRY